LRIGAVQQLNAMGTVIAWKSAHNTLETVLIMSFPLRIVLNWRQIKLIMYFHPSSFLANRLAKCTIGLSELDKAIGNVEKIGKVSVDEKENTELYRKFHEQLDEILRKYF
jgi:hypothetical protein